MYVSKIIRYKFEKISFFDVNNIFVRFAAKIKIDKLTGIQHL